jgi:DNA-binding beta-propeller fold protein YncE
MAYVSCPEDTIAFPGKRGCISVIDLNTNTLIKNIYSGHQPHGIAIDFDKNELIVANRNVSSDGPAPHHSSDCGGRNGYVTFIDLKTLDIVKGRKIEISVDPYFVAIRE